jgi:hypothetical protein
MKSLVTVVTLVVGLFLINCLPALSQEQGGILLSPSETNAYHACLFEAWIQDYCRANSGRWSPRFDQVFRACVVANGGGRFPLVGYWFNFDDYCRNAARGLVR